MVMPKVERSPDFQVLSFIAKRKFAIIIVVSFFISVISFIPIRLAIANYLKPNPQAILTLGGGHPREIFTAQFALSHPDLPIWVSSGTREMKAREIFQSMGVSHRRVYIDRRATDTVTNFTTLVGDFKKQKIGHIYLITDDFHLPRAKAIAFIVLGSTGITYTPVAIATDRLPESKSKIFRDAARACLWVFTRHTGSSLRKFQ